MNFSFHAEAEEEFNQAIDYYENIEPSLGIDFALEVHAAIQRAVDFPEAWAALNGEVRRSLVDRFPYGVLYIIEPEEIFVVAVMNLHRKPMYWGRRI